MVVLADFCEEGKEGYLVSNLGPYEAAITPKMERGMRCVNTLMLHFIAPQFAYPISHAKKQPTVSIQVTEFGVGVEFPYNVQTVHVV